MKKAIFVLAVLLLIAPAAHAGVYGALNFGKGDYSVGEARAQESPSGGGGGGSSGGSSGGGGGGGAPAVPIVNDFSVDQSTLKVVLKQGQVKEEKLAIKNTGNTIIDVKAFLEGLEKFKIYPEENELAATLNIGEEKPIRLVFKALESETPGIYPAKIKFKAPSVEKEISAVIEVDSAEPLFDVDIEVLPATEKVFPGDEILVEVNLINVRGFGRVDVVVDYAIMDFQGNVYATEHETLAVETQARFTRSILVPSSMVPGTYAAFAKVTYADASGVSSDLFEVQAKSIRLYQIQKNGYRILLLAAAIVLTALIAFLGYRIVSRKKPKSEAAESEELRAEEKLKKLAKELESLEEAYKSGYLSEDSYRKGKERIEGRMVKMKK